MYVICVLQLVKYFIYRVHWIQQQNCYKHVNRSNRTHCLSKSGSLRNALRNKRHMSNSVNYFKVLTRPFCFLKSRIVNDEFICRGFAIFTYTNIIIWMCVTLRVCFR